MRRNGRPSRDLELGVSFPGVTTRIIYFYANQPMVSRLGLTDITTVFISVLYLYKHHLLSNHYGDSQAVG